MHQDAPHVTVWQSNMASRSAHDADTLLSRYLHPLSSHLHQTGHPIAFLGHMATIQNLYDILGVPQRASNEDGA